MSAEQMKKECNDFLSSRFRFSVDIGKNLEEHFKQKEWLMKLLDVGSDLRRSLVVKNDLGNGPMKKMLNFIIKFSEIEGEIKDLKYIVSKGNNLKISKVIDGSWDKIIEGCSADISGDLSIGRAEFLKIYIKCIS